MKTQIVHSIPLDVSGTAIVERISYDDGEAVFQWKLLDSDGDVQSHRDIDFRSPVEALRDALNFAAELSSQDLV